MVAAGRPTSRNTDATESTKLRVAAGGGGLEGSPGRSATRALANHWQSVSLVACDSNGHRRSEGTAGRSVVALDAPQTRRIVAHVVIQPRAGKPGHRMVHIEPRARKSVVPGRDQSALRLVESVRSCAARPPPVCKGGRR